MGRTSTQHCDTVIVGAGVVGVRLATELAQRGQSVIVVDKDKPGFEASTRNIGAIGIMGKHAADLAHDSVPLWSELAAEGEIGLTEGGRLYLAETEAQMEPLTAIAEKATAQGFTIETLDEEQVRRYLSIKPSRVHGGILCRDDPQIDPSIAMDAFLARALNAGVRVISNTAALAIDVAGGVARGVQLDDRSKVSADAVAVAAGVWSDRLLKTAGVDLPLKMIWAQVAETEPIDKVVRGYIRGPEYGFRQMPSGRIRYGMGGFYRTGTKHAIQMNDLRNLRLWGPILRRHRGSVRLRVDRRFFNPFHRVGVAPKGFEAPFSSRWLADATRRLKAAYPELADLQLHRKWTGLIEMTPDGLPVLGRAPGVDRLYMAAGFNGQGFSLGPVVGRVLAEAICGKDSDVLHRYRLARFKEEKISFPEHFI